MNKFKVDDKILQISAFPNAVAYSSYEKGPSVGIIKKITPKMYRVDFNGFETDIRIEHVEIDFCFYSEEREKELLTVWNNMRSVWSVLYRLQISYHKEDHERLPKRNALSENQQGNDVVTSTDDGNSP